ncbi:MULTISPECIES: hypothetical protein [Bacillus amyloliquefaciens group]|uniref:hypothetical protein n=1 Tax=Bacillus amyloliquefaciens group TaxID=1938374 RepID=UPI000B31788E|nr:MULTISPECIES: hypothetical protein [Bacillus amyloliquefaciens group]ULR35226.1 hypothetical protein MG974_18710 [Bacillus velezensis]WGS38089.1 hypothetical protein PO845_19440 [Bacillus velezensis]
MIKIKKEVYRSEDVFGISRDLPLNYVIRNDIDVLFKDSLKRNKHVVIFGSSKQGKTSLRKKYLSAEDTIVIHCSNKWSLEDIHINILKRAGFEITQSTKKTSSGKFKIVASIKSIFIPALTSSVGSEIEQSKQTEITLSPLELDPEDVNDIISALKSLNFKKYILLEDFHYLNTDAQRDFSIALKAFHENSNFTFIVIGVWLDENRLSIYNGDLTGRVISINADKWTERELEEAITNGEKLLNITFDAPFKEYLLKNCFDSIYIVQEACYSACLEHNINETQENNITIGTDINMDILIKKIVNQQSGRYNSFLTKFSDGFQVTTLEMHKWILYPVITSEPGDLGKGIRYYEIRKSIQSKHPSGPELNPGNLTQALQSVASLQVTKKLQPIIIDYDETNLRLNVVDKSFIMWLQFQELNEILELANLPSD